jgi:Uma2 family endonuclease
MESAFISLAPDWICEVVSPSTQAFDRGEKMDVYAREGVRHAWLVDPLAKLLEVWWLEREKWLRLGSWPGNARVRAEPFEAVEFELAALWAE